MNTVLVEEKTLEYKGHEFSKYTVLRSLGSIEVRAYESVLIAEVVAKGNRDRAINDGFRILAAYIFGNNASKEKIAMTVPVNQAVTVQGWRVQFVMPSKYSLETLPKTGDERIEFKVMKPVKRIVIRFTGFISEGNLNQHLTTLKDYINENSLKVEETPQYSFYDAPWTLPFLRRNEISFILI